MRSTVTLIFTLECIHKHINIHILHFSYIKCIGILHHFEPIPIYYSKSGPQGKLVGTSQIIGDNMTK